MTLRIQDEADLLTAIYDGPFEQPLWGVFLERLRLRAGALYACLSFRPPERAPLERATSTTTSPVELFAGARPPPELTPLYQNLRAERIYALAELLDTTPPPGIADIRVVKLVEPGGVTAWLSIGRAKPGFTAADSALLSALAQHFKRALRNYAAIERERFRTNIANHAIRRLNFGWISLDAQGAIVEADPNAERLLQQSGALRRGRADRLIITDPTLDRRLTETIRGFVSENAKRPRAIRVSQDPWIDMLFVPVEAPGENAAGAAVAIGYIQGDTRSAADGHEEIAELFGLLPSEARLALALSRGFSITEAAAALGLTVETARSYSKKIYAKMGARGQADLIRFILASVLALA